MQSWFGGPGQAPSTTWMCIRGSVGLESTGRSTASHAPAPLRKTDITNRMQHTFPEPDSASQAPCNAVLQGSEVAQSCPTLQSHGL